MLERVLEYTGRKRLLVPLPFWAARLQASVLQLLPNPLLTTDQVTLLEKDNVVSVKARTGRRALKDLGIDPVSIVAVVPDYLERFRAHGEFASFRR